MALPLDDEIDLEGQLSVTRQSTHEAKVELLGRLLDSDNTLFSKQVRDWLAHEGGMPFIADVAQISLTCLSFLTRRWAQDLDTLRYTTGGQ